MNKPLWVQFDNAEAVAQAACQRILKIAREAIAVRGQFRLVLAGGTTPERTYRLLAGTQADWPHWHLYFGDERCLPNTHPGRNSQMAEQAWTGRVDIPPSQIHPIPAELGPEQGAKNYGQLIRSALPFDLVLLGMGEDGHTASLFPGHHHPADSAVVAVHDAPKPPPERISLSAASLGNCRHLLYLITGSGKQQAVAAWRRGEPLPISQIQPMGSSEVLIDAASLESGL